jgi:hypothetical protein
MKIPKQQSDSVNGRIDNRKATRKQDKRPNNDLQNSTQKKAKRLNSFWTFDGRIFAKKTDDSRKTFIRCIQDINDLIQ